MAKLPKWAQDYIKDIVREREVAALNDYVNEQTTSPFSRHHVPWCPNC